LTYNDSVSRLRMELYYKNDYMYLIFPIVNFPFICSNISVAPVYGIYISIDTILQSLLFLAWFPWQRVDANKEATEPNGQGEVVTS